MPETAHGLLGERVRVLAERLGRERLDRVLDTSVERAALDCERSLAGRERAPRRRGLRDSAVAIGERPTEREEVDAGRAGHEPDEQCEDRHEGNAR